MKLSNLIRPASEARALSEGGEGTKYVLRDLGEKIERAAERGDFNLTFVASLPSDKTFIHRRFKAAIEEQGYTIHEYEYTRDTPDPYPTWNSEPIFIDPPREYVTVKLSW